MLDIGWTELVVVAIVLIVVVGPKDLPPMLRAFGRMTSKMRGMAADFRRQFDEALREADLDDVRKTISDAQSLNPTTALRDAMNPLRQLGNEIKSDLQKATTPDRPVQPAVPEPVAEPANGAVAAAEATKPADPVASAAVASVFPKVESAAVNESKAAEVKPKRVAKPRGATAPPKASATATPAPKKASAATGKKAPAKKKMDTDQAQAVTKSKTRAASRRKGDA